MEKKYPILSALALRLLSMHATSCMSERNWSVWRFTCRDNRRRLALQKVQHICFIIFRSENNRSLGHYDSLSKMHKRGSQNMLLKNELEDLKL